MTKTDNDLIFGDGEEELNLDMPVKKARKKRVKKQRPVGPKKLKKSDMKETTAKKAQVKKSTSKLVPKKDRRAKKVKPEEKESKKPRGPKQDELRKKFTGKEKLKREPVAKDFNWRPMKRKNIWDGTYGVWISRDPCARFKDYPVDFVVDPVTKLPMKRVKSYDRNLLKDDYGQTKEAMYKVNRRTFLKANPEVTEHMGETIMDVEYFAISSDRKLKVAVSFGPDGQSPADQLS